MRAWIRAFVVFLLLVLTFSFYQRELLTLFMSTTPRSLLTTASFPPFLLPATRLVGSTPFFSLRSSTSISYSLYVPPEHYNPDPLGSGPFRPSPPSPSSSSSSSSSPYTRPLLPLIVTVHGTSRDAAAARDLLIPLANRSRAAVLAPLFPAGSDGPNDLDSYKTLRPALGAPGRLQADQALREILDEVTLRWPGVDARRILLVGFSGGGSFALRFALAWPGLVRAVGVGALTGGSVLGAGDRENTWPVGLKDVRSIFGEGAFRLDELRGIEGWQLVVGDQDDALEGSLEGIAAAVEEEKEEASRQGREANWTTVVKRLQRDRAAVLQEVMHGLQDYGVETTVEIVPGAGHSRADLQPTVERFLARELERYWHVQT